MTAPITGFHLANPSWRNWVGNQSCVPAKIVTASQEQDVVDAVREARRSGLRLRTPGTGHSFTGVACTDGILLDTRALSGLSAIDAKARTATAKAHTTIAQFGAPLWDAGLALQNQGDIDTQTIAGAVATSTHGSGAALGSFSSILTACRLVDGEGNVRELSLETTPDAMAGAQCSIGMLGVMTELTLKVAPAYHIHEQIVFMPIEEVRERWSQLLAEYRHFSFFWMPTDASSQLYGFPPAKADHCMVKLYRETDEQPGARTLPPNERIDRSYRIYPHVFEPNFYELEYFLPAEAAREIFEDQRAFMLRNLPDAIFPMEVRFVRADEAWLSPNYGRDSVVISVSGKPGTNYWPYLKACDERLYERGGRPHWGKLHFMTEERLAARFPKFEAFKALRRAFDPAGMFLNDHLAPMFG
jgi:FAD/FMN-containing dehydrogenase